MYTPRIRLRIVGRAAPSRVAQSIQRKKSAAVLQYEPLKRSLLREKSWGFWPGIWDLGSLRHPATHGSMKRAPAWRPLEVSGDLFQSTCCFYIEQNSKTSETLCCDGRCAAADVATGEASFQAGSSAERDTLRHSFGLAHCSGAKYMP